MIDADEIRIRLSPLRRLSWVPLLLAFGLVIAGIGMIEVAEPGDSATWFDSYAGKQAMRAGLGILVFLVTLVPSYRLFERAAYPFYVVVLALLLAATFGGTVRNDARRWLEIGPFLLQPSELMKFSLILALARTLRYPRVDGRWRTGWTTIVLTGIPLVLVIRQPDLGTALLYLPIPVVLLFLSGVRLRVLFALGLCCLLIAPIFAVVGLKEYQRDRIRTFLDPRTSDENDEGYHRTRSLLAMGSGRVFGCRSDEELQSLELLPERHTDFIFAVVGARFGFVGSSAVLLAYAALILALLNVSARTREPFGRLLSAGVATMLATQIIVNVSMTVGLAPITGMPLPFMSYGGSSLLTSFAALGLALNVSFRRIPILAGEDFS